MSGCSASGRRRLKTHGNGRAFDALRVEQVEVVDEQEHPRKAAGSQEARGALQHNDHVPVRKRRQLRRVAVGVLALGAALDRPRAARDVGDTAGRGHRELEPHPQLLRLLRRQLDVIEVDEPLERDDLVSFARVLLLGWRELQAGA